MIKKLVVLFVLFSMLISACVVSSTQPTDQVIPPETDAPSAQTNNRDNMDSSIATSGGNETDEEPTISIAIVSATAVPSIDDTHLDTLAFGYNFEYLLTFDKNIWKSTDYSQGYKSIELIGASDCSIHQNFGRGVPETWQRTILQETIGQYDFQVVKWIDLNTTRIELVTYSIDAKSIEIAIDPGSNPEACLDAVKEVLKDSANNDFGPIK